MRIKIQEKSKIPISLIDEDPSTLKRENYYGVLIPQNGEYKALTEQARRDRMRPNNGKSKSGVWKELGTVPANIVHQIEKINPRAFSKKEIHKTFKTVIPEFISCEKL